MSRKTWATTSWAEQAEEEEKQEAAKDPQTFPSLKDALSTKQKKKTKMSLQEFTNQPTFKPALGLTPDEILRLPTGPKERSPHEMEHTRLGGGFNNYGRSNRDGDRDHNNNNNNTNRRSYGGFDDNDNRRASLSRVSDFDQPSRADGVDNWALGKKPLPSFDSNRSSNRYSSLGGGGNGSRADEIDNWGAGKKPLPVQSSRYSSFGSGYRDTNENDRWSRGESRDVVQERPRLVLDKPRREGVGGVVEQVVKTNKPNPFGAARPREEILAEMGLDWKKVDLEIEAKKTSRPGSSQSSRPGSSQSMRSEGLQGVEGGVKTRPKVNPFGDAKPREVLLEEKGLDWKKMDLELEHRSVERAETEAEKILKEEIEVLKKELEKESVSKANGESLEGSGRDETSLRDLIRDKERDLEMLIRELDDKVRFGQKAIERPGSGAGRVGSFSERPPSRSGSFEESRSIEIVERPRSRGTGDAWARQGGNDRRTFPGGGGDRGFLGNRDMGRSRSRERW